MLEVISTQKPARIESGTISKWAENEKQEDSSTCQTAWVTTCPQTSPYFSEPRELSEIPVMFNNERDSLECTFNSTNSDEFMHKLNLPILW